MLEKILQAISSFFSSIFGGGQQRPAEPTRPQQPPTTGQPTTPQPEQPTTPTTPPVTEQPSDLEEPDLTIPQDGSEMQPDSIIVVANEFEELEVRAGEQNPPLEENDTAVTGPVTNVEEPAPPTSPATPGTPPSQTTHKARYLWLLDNGHGKLTQGKRSPVLPEGGRLFEYEFNRDIVRRIIEKLDPLGVQYFNVVPEVEIDNFLSGRVNRANNKKSDLPKIFVSIHSNAAPTRPGSQWAPDSISGIETWHYYNSKSGRAIASVFQRHLVEFTGFRNRHLKSQPSGQFYVLRYTNMPAILTENGFYNNRQEVQELMKDTVRQAIADAHVAAILEIERNGIGSGTLQG